MAYDLKKIACSAALVVAIATAMIPCQLARAEEAGKIGFIKGYSWGWTGNRGEYEDPAAADSMKRLADTGTEWVCIAFATTMTSPDEPEFGWSDANPSMVTDDEIRHAIELARANGMQVVLKPVVNVADGTWRAWIKFFRPVTEDEAAAGTTGTDDPWGTETVFREGLVQDEKQWEEWWESFSGFVVHYARIAEEKDVPLLCLGCEMNSTEEFENEWRDLIAEVRNVYSGELTYDCNHGREKEIAWWDALDLISVSAYYPVPPPEGQEIEEAIQRTTPKSQIVRELEVVKSELSQISEAEQKPILFIETGVTSVRGCARFPWTHPGATEDQPLDQQEQVNYYEAMFEVFWDEPWFRGFTWWDWPARLYPAAEADSNGGFCVYGKQAEDVLHEWYAKPRN